MDQNLDIPETKKERFLSFAKKNKIKFFFLIIVILVTFVSLIIFSEFKKRKNILLSEKFIKAGLLLNNKKSEEAKNYYEEIVLSGNKFYSILALNIIIEKNLIEDQEKIINYFVKLEKNNLSDEFKDLVLFKKALFLIKSDNFDEGKNILEELIGKNSEFKLAAQEIIN